MNPYRNLESGRQIFFAKRKKYNRLYGNNNNNSAVRHVVIVVVTLVVFLLLLSFHYVVFPSNFNFKNGFRGANVVYTVVPAVINRYFYNYDTFQSSIIRWRATNQQMNLHNVLVVLQQPLSPSFPRETFIGMIHDALSSKHAQVLAYFTNYDSGFVSLTRTMFAMFVDSGQLIMLLSEKSPLDIRNATFDVLSDGLIFAYLLDLVSQSTSHFTLVLNAGWKLRKLDTEEDYVEKAVNYYKHIDSSRKIAKDLNRTCWLDLSDAGVRGATNAIIFDTAEHALRMSILLRSTLPYNRRNASDILGRYCKQMIWAASVVTGPSLFTSPTRDSETTLPMTTDISSSYVDAHDLIIPRWIDTSSMLGPHKNDVKPPYWITFGVNAMNRPIVNTTYLEACIGSLLEILEEDFMEANGFRAVIVVLVGGNSAGEIRLLHTFMENKYANAMARSMIKLVDSPIESYEDSFKSMRVTFNTDSAERRYWRSKQNLDIAALLRAASGLSDYIMLLEDDTGFHTFFGTMLKSTLHDDVNASNPISTNPWARADFGFGYSGILIHAVDVPVYAQLHITFFDEIPCDVLNIAGFIRDGEHIYPRSPSKWGYAGNLFLRHMGVHSSLIGKTQEVW